MIRTRFRVGEFHSLSVLLSAILLPWHVAHAVEVTVSDRAALQQAMQQAVPGTVIRIAPGTYRGGLFAQKLKGEKDKPIIITAADSKQPPVFKEGDSGIQLSGCSYVELSDLRFTGIQGNGVNIDDAGDRSTPSRGMVLRRLAIVNHWLPGNRDGIKMSGVDGFTIEGCRVERWGTSGSAIDFVGCHEGVVENCEFTNDPGYMHAHANGVQTKGGSRAIVIRRCRFMCAGGRAVNVGGSTGLEYMRPADPGFEAKDITVEDCYFCGSAPVAFVGVDGATFHHNTVFAPARWVMRILQENQNPGFVPCRNGIFRDNLIVFRSSDLLTAVNVGEGTEPQTFRFENNAWFCKDDPARTKPLISLPVPEVGGVYGTDPRLKNIAEGDFMKAADSPLKKYGVREQP